MSSSTSLPVSVTECTASPSIDADPVMRKAANLAIAMPRLAASAATTDFTGVAYPPANADSLPVSWFLPLFSLASGQVTQVLDRGDRQRVDAARDPQVHRRVVKQ